MTLFRKKLVLTATFLVLIAAIFWGGSRYPQLNSKALVGTDNPSMGISFDVVFEVNENDALVSKVVKNTVNWMDTNKKGMTFGFLFGAAFILLFTLLKDVQLKNRFLNTALGSIIGAPLGVCVNCAAPIAKGMRDAGARSETALATMITSPTMNVIVLSMLFSFLPLYLVWLKIAFTLAFIFIVIPITSSISEKKSVVFEDTSSKLLPVFNLEADEKEKIISSTWARAIQWTVKSYAKSLFFLVKTTLPLMILAGLLGNVLISVLPLESLVDLVQNTSLVEKVIYMMVIAAVATFLPVPIAFDVIITAILWSAGLNARYAMILLFCLGTYSIYSSFVVSKSFSFKLSITLFASTILFGLLAGITAHYLEKELGIKYRISKYELLKNSHSEPTYIKFEEGVQPGLDAQSISALLRNKNEGTLAYSDQDIQLIEHKFKAKSKKNSYFKKIEGPEIGLFIPHQFSSKEVIEPFTNQRSMASGDVHLDGYPDLLIVSSEQLFLYANLSSESFKRQKINIPQNLHIFNAALVDLNNDGWLDIFFTTYRKGNYVLENHQGNFELSKPIKLPQYKGLILTIAPGFADFNKDGLLDILAGNWSIGASGAGLYTMPEARNYVLINEGDFKFKLKELDGADGETLTLLLADFTDDGAGDLIVGNDFSVPDFYYTGTADSNYLKLNHNPNTIIERATESTMSIETVDINNDLKTEIFQVQIDRLNPDYKTRDINTICGEIANEADKKYCEEVFRKHKLYLEVAATKNFEKCDSTQLFNCIASELVRDKKAKGFESIGPDYFPAGWDDFKFISETRSKAGERYKGVRKSKFEDRMTGGVLLMKDSAGYFRNKIQEFKLTHTGWAWNSKFCDLDNDEWQDLYIANGYLLNFSQESNLFYKNIEGKVFEDKTEKLELTNHLPTSSYCYLDYDLDGDVDLILGTSVGPIFIYENNLHKNNSVAFSISDKLGNHHGIGCIITIYYGDGKHQKREIKLSGGYKSFDEPTVYFGLGEHEIIDKVVIKWSTGGETIINDNLSSGANYEIRRMPQANASL